MVTLLTHVLVPLLSVLLAGSGAVWPLDPRPDVVTGFDPPAERWGAGHRGVDLLGEPGQPVRAARAGTVSYAGLVAGIGVVVVDHGDRRTTYQPVAASVRAGQPVRAGQRIGTLLRGGSHCRPRACLHWGLVRADTYLDPLTLVGAGPVRLLPLFSPLPPRRTPALGIGWLTPGGAPAGTPGAAFRW